MVEGHYTTTLAKRYKEIVTVKIHPLWRIHIICRMEPGQVPVQLQLSKKLLLKPVPAVLLQPPQKLPFIDAIKKVWDKTQPDVRAARMENVEACSNLPREEMLRLDHFMIEHIEYEKLKVHDEARAAILGPPAVPTEDDFLIRAFVKSRVLNYKEIPKPVKLVTPANVLVEALPEEPVADAANVVESGQPRKRAKGGSGRTASHFRVPQPAQVSGAEKSIRVTSSPSGGRGERLASK